MNMSMVDNIRESVSKKRGNISAEQELRDLINQAASKSLKQFIARLDAGEIPVDNISDFVRVLGVYKEINDITTTMEGKGNVATLPELDLRQEKVINDKINEGKIKKKEEDRLDIAELSVDDVSELIRQMDIAQNKANEEAF